ncbi:MAG TPA: sigma-70 family RNA polymerase sigma factor [Acidimicrobiales bacterium]|nr:sigma-70 family RNA polymerase sigma factor [Acidimicrobiales bacterium]
MTDAPGRHALHEAAFAHQLHLLQEVAEGKPAAVRRLLDDVAPIVHGFLYARVGGNGGVAEDLLQDTLLEGVRSAASYRGEAALSTWLCTIARRRLARYYESERRAEAARHGLQVLPAPAAGIDEEQIERRDEVIRALGRMPAVHRQVLVLKYLDGMPVQEIATELGRSRVQVQSLLQRARDGLRRELEADGA